MVQYPSTDGRIEDFRDLCERAHAEQAVVTAAADLLGLALLVPPGEWGADVAIGNTQRFGVPLGYGGPHAAYFATREEHKRHVPGRIIGSPPLGGGPLEGVTVDIDTQIREYNEAMGWDAETGVPRKQTLLDLGLDFVAADLHA